MARLSTVRAALPVGLTLGILVVLAIAVAAVVQTDLRLGQDFGFYRDAGERWLTTGAFYLPHQVAGPYDLRLMVDVLYPPTALILFAPLALLPEPIAAAAWWGIPAVLLAWQIRRDRPARWTWPIVALLLLWPRSYGSILWGSSDIWVLAGVSAGLRWGWPAALIVLKPSFAPFALVGIRRRAWWIAVAVLAAGSLLALPLWIDYLHAMQNVRGLGLDYSVFNLPIVAIPLVLYLGRTRRAPAPTAEPTPERAVGALPPATARAEPA